MNETMADAPVSDQRRRERRFSSDSILAPSLLSSLGSTGTKSKKQSANEIEALELEVYDAQLANKHVQSDLPNYNSLEGTLLYRKGLSAKTPWKQSMRMYCVLKMTEPDGGSLSCYRFVGLNKKEANAAYTSTKLHKDDSGHGLDEAQLCLDIAADLPWIIRDVENDPTAFVVEIPTSGLNLNEDEAIVLDEDRDDADKPSGYGVAYGGGERDIDEINIDESDDEDDLSDADEDGLYIFWGGDDDDDDYADGDMNDAPDVPLLDQVPQVKKDLHLAMSKGKPLRYCFKCPDKTNEKALWLKAFSKLGRLSSDSQKKKGLFGTGATLTPASQRRSRIRTAASADFVRLSTKLEREEDLEGRVALEGTELEEQVGTKEYKVRPKYAYPHRWMTHRELTEEMLEPSSQFHDLRLPPATASSPEIGLLRVEVLQCLGLPKQKSMATSTSVDPNAVAYLVCGSYAFTTDIIPNCAHPMWLRKMRRACAVPIFHGYARLYAGVFHDDGSKGNKDVFIGRIALELARLRPGCTYDVTLPLRKSTQVYSRRRRGAMRLRFHLDYRDERQIALSYLPKLNQSNDSTTTLTCGDPKAFRNVALTVHGSHLPGRFSADQLMAIVREFKLISKVLKRMLIQFAEDLIVWKNPAVSGFVFCAWMHCCYAHSVALVPVYVTSFLFLQLMGNYARSVAEGSTTGPSFLPPTFEEMLLATFIAPKDSPSIEPLDMQREASGGDTEEFVVQTHKPQGMAVFHALGFIEENDYRVGACKEFPLSSIAGYPRFDVEESLATSSAKRATTTTITSGQAGQDVDTLGGEDGLDKLRNASIGEMPYQPRLGFKKPLPEQNIDKRLLMDKPIAEELLEIEEKVNRATGDLFSQQAYVVKDTSRPPWGKRPRRSGKDEDYNIKRHLDKLLNLGPYSQWMNPMIGKMVIQFEPILRIIAVILNAYRAFYNIFTWQDPYMSFWFSVGCVTGSATLFMLPWRPIMFAVGLIFMGPQNWGVRVFREFVWGERQGRPASRFMRAFRELLTPDVSDDGKKGKETESIAQPIFQCHAPANKQYDERKHNGPSGAQHVAVPYGRLIFQRFYDWPPSPQYARVVKGIQAPAPLLPFQGNVFVAQEEQSKPSASRQSKPLLTQAVTQSEAPPSVPPSRSSTLSPSLNQSVTQSIRSKPDDNNGNKAESVAGTSSTFLKRTMNSLAKESKGKKGREKDSLKNTKALENTVVTFPKNATIHHDEDISVISTDFTNDNKVSNAGSGLMSAGKFLTSRFNRTKSSARPSAESEMSLTPLPDCIEVDETELADVDAECKQSIAAATYTRTVNRVCQSNETRNDACNMVGDLTGPASREIDSNLIEESQATLAQTTVDHIGSVKDAGADTIDDKEREAIPASIPSESKEEVDRDEAARALAQEKERRVEAEEQRLKAERDKEEAEERLRALEERQAATARALSEEKSEVERKKHRAKEERHLLEEEWQRLDARQAALDAAEAEMEQRKAKAEREIRALDAKRAASAMALAAVDKEIQQRKRRAEIECLRYEKKREAAASAYAEEEAKRAEAEARRVEAEQKSEVERKKHRDEEERHLLEEERQQLDARQAALDAAEAEMEQRKAEAERESRALDAKRAASSTALAAVDKEMQKRKRRAEIECLRYEKKREAAASAYAEEEAKRAEAEARRVEAEQKSAVERKKHRDEEERQRQRHLLKEEWQQLEARQAALDAAEAEMEQRKVEAERESRALDAKRAASAMAFAAVDKEMQQRKRRAEMGCLRYEENREAAASAYAEEEAKRAEAEAWRVEAEQEQVVDVPAPKEVLSNVSSLVHNKTEIAGEVDDAQKHIEALAEEANAAKVRPKRETVKSDCFEFADVLRGIGSSFRGELKDECSNNDPVVQETEENDKMENTSDEDDRDEHENIAEEKPKHGPIERGTIHPDEKNEAVSAFQDLPASAGTTRVRRDAREKRLQDLLKQFNYRKAADENNPPPIASSSSNTAAEESHIPFSDVSLNEEDIAEDSSDISKPDNELPTSGMTSSDVEVSVDEDKTREADPGPGPGFAAAFSSVRFFQGKRQKKEENNTPKDEDSTPLEKEEHLPDSNSSAEHNKETSKEEISKPDNEAPTSGMTPSDIEIAPDKDDREEARAGTGFGAAFSSVLFFQGKRPKKDDNNTTEEDHARFGKREERSDSSVGDLPFSSAANPEIKRLYASGVISREEYSQMCQSDKRYANELQTREVGGHDDTDEEPHQEVEVGRTRKGSLDFGGGKGRPRQDVTETPEKKEKLPFDQTTAELAEIEETVNSSRFNFGALKTNGTSDKKSQRKYKLPKPKIGAGKK